VDHTGWNVAVTYLSRTTPEIHCVINFIGKWAKLAEAFHSRELNGFWQSLQS